uniref:Uncharacterized protein n=1 Tax=Timema poppense TaxID=170557 RepID=A0A7R9H5B5_TIMPO|nr:unnamed protein product [Timema poppensis]
MSKYIVKSTEQTLKTSARADFIVFLIDISLNKDIDANYTFKAKLLCQELGSSKTFEYFALVFPGYCTADSSSELRATGVCVYVPSTWGGFGGWKPKPEHIPDCWEPDPEESYPDGGELYPEESYPGGGELYPEESYPDDSGESGPPNRDECGGSISGKSGIPHIPECEGLRQWDPKLPEIGRGGASSIAKSNNGSSMPGNKP